MKLENCTDLSWDFWKWHWPPSYSQIVHWPPLLLRIFYTDLPYCLTPSNHLTEIRNIPFYPYFLCKIIILPSIQKLQISCVFFSSTSWVAINDLQTKPHLESTQFPTQSDPLKLQPPYKWSLFKGSFVTTLGPPLPAH